MGSRRLKRSLLTTISDRYAFFYPDLEFRSVNRVKSSAILNLSLAFPNAVTTLAVLWKTSVLLRYVDIFVGKVVIADFLGAFGRSALAVHLLNIAWKE